MLLRVGGTEINTNRRAWDSEEWVEYFQRNADNLRPIPWDAGAEITEVERTAISSSIQGFQLGESSEGRHLFQRAKQWSDNNCDHAYTQAIRLFIKEEQRHAYELGQFMDINGIPRVKRAFSDSAFRFLRRSAGLETSIVVLITAEVIAQVYYVALRDATASTVLQNICHQILQDEEEHVRFQSERLALMAARHGRLRFLLRRGVQRCLMAATLPVVWSAHHRAYRAGRFSFGRYASETWAALERALLRTDPRAYEPAALFEIAARQ